MKETSRSVKYLIRITVVCVISALIIVFAAKVRPDVSEQTSFQIKYDLTLWYYDESLTPYLTSFGDDYFKTCGKRVDVKLVPSLDFFKTINQKNIEGVDAPDLYIIDSTKLENAYLSSLSKPVEHPDLNSDIFLSKALEAASYKGIPVGYPLCYNTAFFACNKELMSDMPRDFDSILQEQKAANKTAAEDTAEEQDPVTEETAAGNNVRLLEFDVSNLLYTYFFIGNQINLGGKTGDDASSFDLSQESYAEALKYVRKLGKNLALDPKLTDYKTVERHFMRGEVPMAILSVASLTRLYGTGLSFTVNRIPPLSGDLKTDTMSQTSVLCVNPDSRHVADAEQLAHFLSIEHADRIFETCGYMSTLKQTYDNADLNTITEIYESSLGLPKLIETENLWENINSMLLSVWNGEKIERAQSKLNVAVYVALSTRTEQEDK